MMIHRRRRHNYKRDTTLLRLIDQLLSMIHFLLPLYLLCDSFSVLQTLNVCRCPGRDRDRDDTNNNDRLLYNVPPCYYNKYDYDAVQSSSSSSSCADIGSRGNYRYEYHQHHDHDDGDYWWFSISIISVASAFSPSPPIRSISSVISSSHPTCSHNLLVKKHSDNIVQYDVPIRRSNRRHRHSKRVDRDRDRDDRSSNNSVRLRLLLSQSQQPPEPEPEPEEVVDGQYYYQVGVVDSDETTPTAAAPAAAQYEYYQQAPLALDNQVQVVAGSKQQEQQQQQEQQERIEREKWNYLALAKEAHSKFFVDQISQEEYVRLALMAWNDAYGDGGSESGEISSTNGGSGKYSTASKTTTTTSSSNNNRINKDDNKNSNSSNNNNNPFELLGGLGAKLFGGESKRRPTPSTSLIGGLGLLNNEYNDEDEESSIPYGLRVGNGNRGINNISSGNGAKHDGDAGGSSTSFGGGSVVDNVIVAGKGSMSYPPLSVSKGEQKQQQQQQQQQKVVKREKLKGATSGSDGTAAIIGKSSIGRTTKKIMTKGGQFQPPPTKQAFNTMPNPVTFKKGLVGNNKIGEGVLPTKKMMPSPTKKMSTFVTKASLQPPPSISNEINSAKAPSLSSSSSSVLKSIIDENKEEIARTKSWVEDEKRLGDVRKKVAEIQGGTTVPMTSDTTNPQFQFVVEAREGEASATTKEESNTEKKRSYESIWSLLPKKPSAVTASNAVKDDVEEVKKEVAEGENSLSIQDVSSAVNVESVVAAAEAADAIGNESREDWVQEQNRSAQERAAVRIAQGRATKKTDEGPIVADPAAAAAATGNGRQVEDTTNDPSEDWIQEQNRLARQRAAERMVLEKQRQTEAVAAAAAMAQEERRLKARAEGEANLRSDRLSQTTKQSNVDNKRKMTEMEKSRSEQFPNGEYWLANQNRVVEERQKARVVAKEAAGVQLKGSDGTIRPEQPIVSVKIAPTQKRFEVANNGKGMPLKVDSLKGNQPPFPVRSDVQQQPNVEPAVSSQRSDGPKIPTTLRGSNESKMIEKGFVPFTGPTSTQELNAPLNLPQNAQQVVAPAIPINKIEPSVASKMMAPMIQKKESERRSLDLAEAEAWAGSLDDINVSTLPVIRVGNRIRSSLYGTTHQVLLFLPKENGGYEILSCVAKRPWTMAELYANVPSKVSAFEEQQSESAFDELTPPEPWEVDYNAKSVRRYWEVEIHCNKKFQQKKELYDRLQMQALSDKKQKEDNGDDSDGADDGVSFAIRVAEVATPKFYDVYPDDGSGGTNDDDIIPEYGLFGQDVWNKTIEFGHDWLVYESKMEVNELTLLDAMMMQHEINKQFLEDGYQVHHLYGIQQAMKLPDAYGFGGVLDVIIRSLLENIAFLASCNVVHRKLNPSNIICDENNGRLRIINFGDAVDLDPKETVRVGLDNDTLESNAPGAIANSLAADIFSVALLVCELLFDFDEATFTAQIKDVGYDLDAWLQRTLTADERPLGLDEALWYLSERRGLWALLKSMIKPNPLRRKITSASMQQFNEIIALKDGKIKETDQILAGGDESFLNSVLFPSGSDNSSSGNVNIPLARKTPVASIDDIPQTQYTSSLPRTSLSSSVLSELAEKANDADDEQNQSTREEGPNSNPKMQNPAHTASSSNSDTYNDITRATFTPARTSKLTAMLAPKSRDPLAPKQQSLPEQQSGNYYDITRASFQRVSPQPMALTASQLYALLRDGAAGFPPQFEYNLTQSGYIPETNVRQSGNNIVLPQRGVSVNLPRGYAPARPTESISQEAYEEVEQWLVSRLPRLQKVDVSNYCWSLIDDGFDSAEMLEEIEFDDLHFMKKAHQRALAKALSQEINSVPEKAVFQSNDQSLPKKVYKVEEALGEAARKGIEALVAASKTDNQQKPDDRKQMLQRYKAYEAKIAAEKAETERKIAEVERRMQAETFPKAGDERELKAVQERIEAELQTKAQKELRLRELEKEIERRAKAEDERELQEFQVQDRIETEL